MLTKFIVAITIFASSNLEFKRAHVIVNADGSAKVFNDKNACKTYASNLEVTIDPLPGETLKIRCEEIKTSYN